MDLSLALADPNMAEKFTIIRSEGAWGLGGWQETKRTNITARGVVSVASAKQMDTLPEADTIHGAIVVNTRTQIFGTHIATSGPDDARTPGTADIIVWRGQNYRVVTTNPYRTRGYWWAIAQRMLGA